MRPAAIARNRGYLVPQNLRVWPAADKPIARPTAEHKIDSCG
jgi:hypothetical protein